LQVLRGIKKLKSPELWHEIKSCICI